MKRSTMGLGLYGSLLAVAVTAGCSGGVMPAPDEDSVVGEHTEVPGDRPGGGKGDGPSDKDPDVGEGGGTSTLPDGGDPPPPDGGDPPPPDDGDPPPPPPDDSGTSEVKDCAALGYEGACVGAVSVWFENGTCRVRNCDAENKACGWVSDDDGWGCLGGPGASPVDCSTLGYSGACMAETLVWVQDNACHALHCPSNGQSCVWAGGDVGYDCD